MRPERRTNKYKHISQPTLDNLRKIHEKPTEKKELESKFDMLRTHVGMLQSQIATMSLSIASMQAQIKKIEETLPPQRENVVITIPMEDLNTASSDLHVDDSFDSDSEGYDTDDSPVQTHKVKTRCLKSARQKFVFVPNYVEPPTNDESGYEDSD